MSYEITFGGRFQAGLGITAGKVVVKAGNLYLPATTANVALYPIAGLVVRYQQVPSANYDVGDIAHAGVWPSSLTGLTAATAGVDTYARITSTGSLETTTTPSHGDWLMGRINTDGDLILTGATQYANPTGGVQVVVDIRDYGAVCDGVTDDSDAWDAVMEDVPILGIDVIEVPKTAGGCAISRPIRMCSTDPNYLMNGVTIRGQLATPAVAPALTYLVWLGDRRSGSAASMTASAGDVESGPDLLGITWTHFLLSGCTGANFTAADVGTTGVRISGAADTTLNCQARITKYVSATSVYVAIPDQAAISDANNGAISWLVLDSMIYMQGRALSVQNLSPFIPTGKYVYNFISHTHPTGNSNQLSVSGCSAFGIKSATAGTGVIENILEIGQWIVPTKAGYTNTHQDAANGQYRPWSPTQCDYFRLENALNEGGGTTFDGACIRSANASGQSRANRGIDIGCVAKEYVTLERSDFPNSNGAASSSWALDRPTGGQITQAFFGRTSGQAQMSVRDVHWEYGACLLKMFGSGEVLVSTTFTGGYVTQTSGGPFATSVDGLFQLTAGAHVTCIGMPLDLSGLSHDGVLATVDAAGRSSLSFIGCVLPHWSTLQKDNLREMFDLQGQYTVVNIKDCMVYDSTGVDGLSGVADTTIVGGAYIASTGLKSDERFGASLIDGPGTSNSLFNASNYFGVVTIADTETRKTWVFRDPEIDEDYEDHYYEVLPVLLSKSGAVAATCLPELVETSRRSCTLQMAAAPGAGTSVTYGLRLIRHNQPPTTAFHPQDIQNLYFYFDAEYDLGYNVAISPELQDNLTGRLYWRSQASRRALAFTNASAYDPFAINTSGTDTPANLPSSSVKAGFNNKTVATFSSSSLLRATLNGNEACASPLTIYAVGTAGTGTGDKVICELYDSQHAKFGSLVNDGTNTYLYFEYTALLTGFAWSSPSVVCGVVNGASSALYTNSLTAAVTGTTGAQLTGIDDYLLIGNNALYNKPWSGAGGGAAGDIACLLIYKGAHDATQRSNVMNWLSDRFGITVTP